MEYSEEWERRWKKFNNLWIFISFFKRVKVAYEVIKKMVEKAKKGKFSEKTNNLSV